MSARLKRIADSSRFQTTILTVIGLNAVTLGLQTFSGVDEEIGGLLVTLDEIFLGIFVVELTIRIGAYGKRPWDFFREPWNVFDFVVIGAAFLPGLRENATLLRLARLLRVVRIFSVLPDLRILVRGMASSLGPIASLSALAFVVMYVYGMVGWILFSEGDPENWDTIADAILTLFVVMTLESWPDIMGTAMDITPWAWAYFVSYVLVASFLIINVVIAIIITAIEEAHSEERREKAQAAQAAQAAGGELDELDLDELDPEVLRDRLTDLRLALDDLEVLLGAHASDGDRNRSRSGSGVRMASKGRLKP